MFEIIIQNISSRLNIHSANLNEHKDDSSYGRFIKDFRFSLSGRPFVEG